MEVVRIVPLRVVRPGMRPTGLPPQEGRVRDRLREVEHEVQLQGRGELRVEERVFVPHADPLPPSPELPDAREGLLQRLSAPVDPDVLLHRVLHLPADLREALPAVSLQDPSEDAGLLKLHECAYGVRAYRGLREGVCGRGPARLRPEDEAIAEGVRP